MKRLKRKTYLYLSIFWFALIWTLSSLPARVLTHFDRLNLDKLFHFGVYLILGLMVNRVLIGYRKGLAITLLVYASLLLTAALDEWHQVWIPNRMVSIYDLFANQLGLLTGLLIHLNHDRR